MLKEFQGKAEDENQREPNGRGDQILLLLLVNRTLNQVQAWKEEKIPKVDEELKFGHESELNQ